MYTQSENGGKKKHLEQKRDAIYAQKQNYRFKPYRIVAAQQDCSDIFHYSFYPLFLFPCGGT